MANSRLTSFFSFVKNKFSSVWNFFFKKTNKQEKASFPKEAIEQGEKKTAKHTDEKEIPSLRKSEESLNTEELKGLSPATETHAKKDRVPQPTKGQELSIPTNTLNILASAIHYNDIGFVSAFIEDNPGLDLSLIRLPGNRTLLGEALRKNSKMALFLLKQPELKDPNIRIEISIGESAADQKIIAMTPLSYALVSGNFKLEDSRVKALLKHPQISLKALEEDLQTLPLEIKVEIAQLKTQIEAKRTTSEIAASTRNKYLYDEFPLHRAIRLCKGEEILRHLQDPTIDVNAYDPLGDTPLTLYAALPAYKRNFLHASDRIPPLRTNIETQLLNRKSNADLVRKSDNQLPIMLALQSCADDLVEMLLWQTKSDLPVEIINSDIYRKSLQVKQKCGNDANAKVFPSEKYKSLELLCQFFMHEDQLDLEGYAAFRHALIENETKFQLNPQKVERFVKYYCYALNVPEADQASYKGFCSLLNNKQPSKTLFEISLIQSCKLDGKSNQYNGTPFTVKSQRVYNDILREVKEARIDVNELPELGKLYCSNPQSQKAINAETHDKLEKFTLILDKYHVKNTFKEVYQKEIALLETAQTSSQVRLS